MTFSVDHAKQLETASPIAQTRDLFHIPKQHDKKALYLCGHSLGLQPKTTQDAIQTELNRWQQLGVNGHFEGEPGWVGFDKPLHVPLANVVGAKPAEIMIMNALTVNMHLLMVSFYQPTTTRYKILCDGDLFPSDSYVLQSQCRYHHVDPNKALISIPGIQGDTANRANNIIQLIEQHADSLAMIFLNIVNYKTGEVLPIAEIAQCAHKHGIMIGLGGAHAVGNVPLALHDWGIDFAVWCHYKYLNAGPGGIAGAMIHEKHFSKILPRFEGWWGNDLQSRFEMRQHFDASLDAGAWQLSNPPIFQLAALSASLKIFEAVGFSAITEKSLQLQAFLREGLATLDNPAFQVITPNAAGAYGNQITLRFMAKMQAQEYKLRLEKQGGVLDFRGPDLLRVSFSPLYNTFEDVYNFIDMIQTLAAAEK